MFQFGSKQLKHADSVNFLHVSVRFNNQGTNTEKYLVSICSATIETDEPLGLCQFSALSFFIACFTKTKCMPWVCAGFFVQVL